VGGVRAQGSRRADPHRQPGHLRLHSGRRTFPHDVQCPRTHSSGVSGSCWRNACIQGARKRSRREQHRFAACQHHHPRRRGSADYPGVEPGNYGL